MPKTNVDKRKIFCGGKSTDQVIKELKLLPQDEDITVSFWNGNIKNGNVAYHLSQMKILLNEETNMRMLGVLQS